MTKKKHIKKVNQLTLQECEVLLQRLYKHKDSAHYMHVLQHYRSLMPAMSSAVALNEISVEQGKTATHITK